MISITVFKEQVSYSKLFFFYSVERERERERERDTYTINCEDERQ